MTDQRNPISPSGLYSYEIFETLFKYEIARAQRYPSALTLLHIGLEVQGQGVQAQDQASQVMIDLLNKSLRISDVPAHYHDEFLVLLPSTDETGGRAVADRILGRFKNTQQLTSGPMFRMNVFIGIASQHGDHPISAGQLMAEASTAMNEARRQRAGKTVAFSELGGKPSKP